MSWLIENWKTVVEAAGAVIIAARLIVKLTPTPADDSVLDKIVNFLKHLGLHIDPKS
jgi:peptidyl-tRNA hydrolase